MLTRCLEKRKRVWHAAGSSWSCCKLGENWFHPASSLMRRYFIKPGAIWNQSSHSEERFQREMQFYLSYKPCFLYLPTNRGPVRVLSLFAALWLPDLATVRKKRTPTASLAVPSTCLSIWPLCIFAPGRFKTGWVTSLCPLFFLIQGFCTMSHVLQTTSAPLRNWMYWAQCDSQQLPFHLTSISQLCLYFSA